MACHPPDYLSIASVEGGQPASCSLSNPLLRPLDGSDFAVALLHFQEVSSFLRGRHNDKIVGQVMGMCPSREIMQKLEMNIASDMERVSSSKVSPHLALKSFQRSDASKVFKPEETRPAVWCRRTIYNILCYFVDVDVVKKPYIIDKSFSYLDVYNFLRDRLRSIWQDLTVQHCTKHRAYIECFEISIRFLIYSNEKLCENEEYVLSQNTGLLNTCLDKLMQGYEDVQKYIKTNSARPANKYKQENNPHFDDIMKVLVYSSPHQAEFWSYRLLLHIPQLMLPGGSATFCDIRQRMPEELKESPLVKFAIEVCHVAASGNLHHYFVLMRDPGCSALHAALMNRFAICLRVRFLESLVVGKIARKDINPIDMLTFKSIFGFNDEPEQSVDALLKKYDIQASMDGSRVVLDFEEANGKQLTFDSASLQKLANKFQTSSNVVNNKFEAYTSRQLLFDPDFEYPSGTGPTTCGPPLTDDTETAFGVSSHSSQQQANESGTSIFPRPGGNIFYGATFGNNEGTKEAAPFLFGASSPAAESKVFPFQGTGASDPNPFKFGPDVAQSGGNLFGFGTNSSRNIFGSKQFGSTETEQTAKSGHGGSIFGPASTTEGFKPFTFNMPSTAVVGSNNTSPFAVSGGTSDSKPFAFLGHNKESSDAMSSNPFNSGNISGGATTGTTFFVGSTSNNPPIFGMTASNNNTVSETPLFTFGNAGTTSAANQTSNAAMSQPNEASHGNGVPNIFGISKNSWDKPDVGFQFNQFAGSSHQQQGSSQPMLFNTADFNADGTISVDLTSGSRLTQCGSDDDSSRDEFNWISNIMEIFGSAKELLHVRFKRPRISNEIRITEVTATVSTEPDYIRKLRKIGAFIVRQTFDSSNLNTPKSGRSTIRIRGAVCAKSNVYRRFFKEFQEPERVVDREELTRAMVFNFITEVTPREAVKENGEQHVEYLNERGSKKHLLNMYIAQLEENDDDCIIPPHVECESCRINYRKKGLRNPVTGERRSFKGRVSCLVSTIARCTACVTATVTGSMKGRLYDTQSESQRDVESGATNSEPKEDTQMTCNEMAQHTGQAMMGIARSTSEGAAATGRYLTKFYKTSKRLLSSANDMYRSSFYGGASPFSCIVGSTRCNLESILQASETRLHRFCSEKKSLDGLNIWGTGIFWHVNFFEPLVGRSELIMSSANTSDSVRRLTSALIEESIDDYMNSEYVVGLKKDVLHIAGFDMNTEHLVPGYRGYKRQMLEYYNGEVKRESPKPGDAMKKMGLTVAVSLNFCDDGFNPPPEIYLRSDVNHTKFDGGCESNKRRRIFDGDQGKCASVTESGPWPDDRMIDEYDMRFYNRPSIVFYAFSNPVYIGEADILSRILTSTETVDYEGVSVDISGIDNYGIISAVIRDSTPGIDVSYTACIVTYRISLSKHDLLSIYEFMNPSLQCSISLCGCTEKGREIRNARLLQVIEAIEESLMEEVVDHAMQVNTKIDIDVLRKHIIFACVGFQLHVDPPNAGRRIRGSKSKKNKGPTLVLIPRLIYEEGFARAIQVAAATVVEYHDVLLLQRPYQIPNLHGFLKDLIYNQLKGKNLSAVSIWDTIGDALQSTIDDVQRRFTEDHWDMYHNNSVTQKVESTVTSFSEGTFGYSKQSFVTLLTALQNAVGVLSARSSRSARYGSEKFTLSHRIHDVICNVLSNVIVTEYKVPYAVGLYMANIREQEREVEEET